jgi:DNA-binding response OmpR family regulator
MKRILIVEDDPKMAKLLVNNLKLEDYEVDVAGDGAAGLEKATDQAYDLFIFDVMLPKMTGYELCRQLRAQGSKIPVLMLTAKSQETDKVVGFDVGADDYLTKPFSILELTARLKALLRRSAQPASLAKYESGPYSIDFRRQEAFRGKVRLDLTSKEFQILQFLIEHKEEVVSRERFLKEVWKFEDTPTTRTVDTQVSSLRRKLGWSDEGRGPKIITVHNSGYRFAD